MDIEFKSLTNKSQRIVIKTLNNTDKMEEANKIADQLEDEIAKKGYGLTYTQIVGLSELTAMKVRENVPMYTGNLNPKWKLWDDVIALLKGRDVESET